MTPDQVFSAANATALISWLLLIALPRRESIINTVIGIVVPVMLAIVYTAIVATNFFGARGGFSSLPDVALLFSNPWMLLAGWIHYLAFDLLVGRWEVLDARKSGVQHWVVVPCLVMTF